MKVAIAFQRLGPYHAARLAGAGAAGVTVTAIEVCSADDTYAWNAVGLDAAQRLVLSRSTASDRFAAHRRRLRSAAELNNLDAVAVPGWASPGALALLSFALDRRIPALLMSDSTAHDEPRRRWKEAVKRRVVGLYSAALVGGAPHVEYAAALGMPRDRIFTGYDVVDNDHFAHGAAAARDRGEALRAELGLPRRYFLASNRFIEKKNLPRLLRAFARYRAQAGEALWDLVLLGDGPLRPALEREVRSLGLEGCVHMPGFKQYDELPAYYGLAGAFVHASTTEQWGLVVNEAMAAGLPVIVSQRCGCAPDLVVHGENGFTFDPFDEAALAACLLRMAGGECGRAAMAAASARIVARWTPRTFAENLLRAAQAAQAGPVRRASALDRALLWALAHR